MQPPGDRRDVMYSTGQAAPIPAGAGAGVGPGPLVDDASLSYESGLEVKARSQWAYARMRFLRHRLAVAGLVVLIIACIFALFPAQVAPYAFDEFDFEHIVAAPTWDGWHIFGTDQLGRDYLSRVIFALRTSLWVALFVALVATAIGTVVGAIAGYYGGKVDNFLMRLVDLILVVPFLAVLLVLSAYLGQGKPLRVGMILALLLWVNLARIVRGTFLSLREKEFVEAAKASGAGDLRIMFRHMLPSTVGPIVVTHDRARRGGDPARGGAFVPRLRRSAADAGARQAHRGRPDRGLHHVVARDVPRNRDRGPGARGQLHRRRPARRT